METQFDPLVKRWPKNVGQVSQLRPVLILSSCGLSSSELDQIRTELVEICGPHQVSCILSLKMMHIYFRTGLQTLDYRPHRGPFSKLVTADYRVSKTDRMEAILELRPDEFARLQEYTQHIEKSPHAVLGKPHPLQMQEPDFTVFAKQTHGQLHANAFVDNSVKHNCLTWFTTAPLGFKGEPLWELIGMTPSDLAGEAHSYIVQFYRYLTTDAPVQRVPAVVFWTEKTLEDAIKLIRAQERFVENFYHPKAPQKSGTLVPTT